MVWGGGEQKKPTISLLGDASGKKSIRTTICPSWEIWCFPYAGFFCFKFKEYGVGNNLVLTPKLTMMSDGNCLTSFSRPNYDPFFLSCYEPFEHAFWELGFLWLFSHTIYIYGIWHITVLVCCKRKCLCKCLSTLFTTVLLFHSVKCYVFINFNFGGIRLFTLNTHNAKI